VKWIFDARYETADRESIVALQWRKLQRVLSKAWYTNEFYQTRYQAARVDLANITSLEAFRRLIPTITKEDFLEDQQTDPPFGRRHAYARELEVPLIVTTTSGTSGQGQEMHLQTAEEIRLTGEIYSFHFRWANVNPGEQMFLAMPITMLSGGILEYHGGFVYGLTVYPVGNYDAARKVDLMQRFHPEVILTNTSYMGRLGAMIAPESRWSELKCLSTGAEGEGFTYLKRLEETWGAPVYDRYGSSQAGNDHMFTCDEGIGTESRPGLLHNIDPYMLVEVIDPQTGDPVDDGELGELVITDLYRTDTPVIRCRLKDMAVFHESGYCSCGRPFMGIETASVSRADGMIKIKGIGVWPKAVADTVFGFPEVEEYQVVISSGSEGTDKPLARLMTRDRTPSDRLVGLTERVRSALHDRIGIHFEVELVERGALELGEWKARRWVDERVRS
jgi:phenylacetate-CoA ligase